MKKYYWILILGLLTDASSATPSLLGPLKSAFGISDPSRGPLNTQPDYSPTRRPLVKVKRHNRDGWGDETDAEYNPQMPHEEDAEEYGYTDSVPMPPGGHLPNIGPGSFSYGAPDWQQDDAPKEHPPQHSPPRGYRGYRPPPKICPPKHNPPEENYEPRDQGWSPPPSPQAHYAPPEDSQNDYWTPKSNHGPPNYNYMPPSDYYKPPSNQYGPPPSKWSQIDVSKPPNNYYSPPQGHKPPNYGSKGKFPFPQNMIMGHQKTHRDEDGIHMEHQKIIMGPKHTHMDQGIHMDHQEVHFGNHGIQIDHQRIYVSPKGVLMGQQKGTYPAEMNNHVDSEHLPHHIVNMVKQFVNNEVETYRPGATHNKRLLNQRSEGGATSAGNMVEAESKRRTSKRMKMISKVPKKSH